MLAAIILIALVASAFIGTTNTQRTTTLWVYSKTTYDMYIDRDPDPPYFILDGNMNRWSVDSVSLWKSMEEGMRYNVTFYAGFFPTLGIYPTIIEATPLKIE